MQCREFREITESYLNDELLVETNHQVFRHLENCPNCRAEFAERREFRKKLNSAFAKAEEFKINPTFARRLNTELNRTALQKSVWQKVLAARVIIPAMAGLIIVVAFALAFISSNSTKNQNDLANQRNDFKTTFVEISHKAAENHKDCALEKLKTWEALSRTESAEKAIYTEKIVKPLRAKLSDKVEILHAHDCIHDGKTFTHIILRRDNHIISVLLDKSKENPTMVENLDDSIICEKKEGWQVAGFQNNNQAVFVISDFPEAENLNVARIISDAWKQTAKV